MKHSDNVDLGDTKPVVKHSDNVGFGYTKPVVKPKSQFTGHDFQNYDNSTILKHSDTVGFGSMQSSGKPKTRFSDIDFQYFADDARTMSGNPMPQGGSFLPLQEFSDIYLVKNDIIPNSLDDGTGLSPSEKKCVRSLVNYRNGPRPCDGAIRYW